MYHSQKYKSMFLELLFFEIKRFKTFIAEIYKRFLCIAHSAAGRIRVPGNSPAFLASSQYQKGAQRCLDL